MFLFCWGLKKIYIVFTTWLTNHGKWGRVVDVFEDFHLKIFFNIYVLLFNLSFILSKTILKLPTFRLSPSLIEHSVVTTFDVSLGNHGTLRLLLIVETSSCWFLFSWLILKSSKIWGSIRRMKYIDFFKEVRYVSLFRLINKRFCQNYPLELWPLIICIDSFLGHDFCFPNLLSNGSFTSVKVEIIAIPFFFIKEKKQFKTYTTVHLIWLFSDYSPLFQVSIRIPSGVFFIARVLYLRISEKTFIVYLNKSFLYIQKYCRLFLFFKK